MAVQQQLGQFLHICPAKRRVLGVWHTRKHQLAVRVLELKAVLGEDVHVFPAHHPQA